MTIESVTAAATAAWRSVLASPIVALVTLVAALIATDAQVRRA